MAVGEGWRASSRHGCPFRPHPTYVETTLPRSGRLVRVPSPRLNASWSIDAKGRGNKNLGCHGQARGPSLTHYEPCCETALGNARWPSLIAVIARLEVRPREPRSLIREAVSPKARSGAG